MRLNDTAIKQLPAPEIGNRVVFDATVKGFGIRVTAAGAKAFVVRFGAIPIAGSGCSPSALSRTGAQGLRVTRPSGLSGKSMAAPILSVSSSITAGHPPSRTSAIGSLPTTSHANGRPPRMTTGSKLRWISYPLSAG
jgi:hypothetical protein